MTWENFTGNYSVHKKTRTKKTQEYSKEHMCHQLKQENTPKSHGQTDRQSED